jgi:uncharacterized protein (DUF427 family)
MPTSPFAPVDPQQALEMRSGVEPTPRWVRVRFAGQVIADSRRALLLTQYGPGRLPTYYFPQADVQMDALVESQVASPDGEVSWRSVQVGGKVEADAAWIVLQPPSPLTSLAGYVSFAWEKMDACGTPRADGFQNALPIQRHCLVLEREGGGASRSERCVELPESDTRMPKDQGPPELLPRASGHLRRWASAAAPHDAVVLARHNSHYFGQLILLRQMMALWPPPAATVPSERDLTLFKQAHSGRLRIAGEARTLHHQKC